jgi:hypothetical protein
MLLATNEYGSWEAADHYPWMKEVAGTQLVEPYKNTQLGLLGPLIQEGEWTYRWQVPDYPDQEDLGDLSNTGPLINVVFKKVGIYSLTVSMMDSTGKTRYQFHTRLICK